MNFNSTASIAINNDSVDPYFKESSPKNVLSIDQILQQKNYESDQESCRFLQENNPFDGAEYQDIRHQTLKFVEQLKQQELPFPRFTEFLNHHQLTSEEGIALLYLAESLLRIPDSSTADLLINDQLNSHKWSSLVSTNSSPFVKFSAWALSRIGTFFSSISEQPAKKDLQKIVTQLIKKSGESVLRQALIAAVKLLGNQCIFAENINKAIKKSGSSQYKSYRFCYQMLGQGAATAVQAEDFYALCAEAIRTLGNEENRDPNASSIALKLSDLHPRYCLSQTQRVINEVGPKLTNLAILAKENSVGLVIEAEESSTLGLTLKLVEQLITNPRLQEWHGLEIVIQAYQKSSSVIIQWLAELARMHQKKLAIRLVKGLLWDQEIRQAQKKQSLTYPVYITKAATDAAYFVCAQKIIDNVDVLTPHFSTHNVFSIFGVQLLIQRAIQKGQKFSYEFQKGYAKGEGIFAHLSNQYSFCCRLIAPVGNKDDILSSIVRHFMESKVNHAFLYEVSKNDPSLENFVQNPFDYLQEITENRSQLLLLERNFKGISLKLHKKIDDLRYKDVGSIFKNQKEKIFEAIPIINGIYQSGIQKSLYNPSHIEEKIGYCIEANQSQARQALDIAVAADVPWDSLEKRLEFLKQVAVLLEERLETLLYLCVVETGMTLNSAIDDFLEALRTCYQIAQDIEVHDKTTELNAIWTEKQITQWEPRGAFVCLTSWNSPILSVVKSVAAALATNNNVILKPASSAGLIAAQIVDCFYEAGAPKEALSFLPGGISAFPFELLTDPRLAGVAFFGSKRTSLKIQNILSIHEKSSFSFVGHTSGMNVMIVDSSALLPQVVEDTMESAFKQSGQLPYALRLVFVQEEIAEEFIKLLKGKMMEWVVGDPVYYSTDSGPIINEKAHRKLIDHAEEMHDIGKLIYKTATVMKGDWFFAPKVYELKEMTHLNAAAFGPVLHLIRFKRDQINCIMKQLNENFPGLVLGIQSTIHSFCNTLSADIKSEEIIINKKMKSSRNCYSALSLEKRLEYLKKFVIQKTISVGK